MTSADAQLAEAVASHRAGELVQAAHLYGEVLLKKPDHVEALQLLGLVAHRLGRSEDGLQFLGRAVALDAAHVPALTNLATVHRDLCRFSEAEEAAQRAIRSDPRAIPARALLLGLYIDQGRMADAEPLVRDLVRDRPDSARFWAAAGTVLDALDRPAEAEAAAGRAVSLDPSLAESWLLRVHLAQRRGDRIEAVAHIERAIALHPHIAEFRLKRGNLAAEAGDLATAEIAFREALRCRPEFVEAAHNLGNLCLRTSQVEEGMRHLVDAARHSSMSWPWVSLVDAIAVHGLWGAEPEWARGLLLEALDRDGVDHQRLAAAIWRQCVQEDVQLIGLDPLLLRALERLQVQDPTWERRLSALRCRALKEVVGGVVVKRREMLRVLTAFAHHGWHAEYAWGVSDDEWRACSDLRARIAEAREDAALSLAAAAMYGPLTVWGNPATVERIALASTDLHDLWLVQVEAPRMEKQLDIPVLALGSDATSRDVRRMYEQNPYPRRVSLHRKPAEPFERVVRSLFPHAKVDIPRGPLRVLVAGCGTGQQALSAATRTENTKVLAVDLSRNSLSVAVRQAREWGLHNIRFAQADLLELGRLDERFDVVECGGVLHHLAEPLAGWRVLVSLVRPGGLMKIGLYSRFAREVVEAGRALCRVWGVEPTAEGIRAARQRILDLAKDDPVRQNVSSPDFYSVSGFRDLLLHVQEHTYTLPLLAEQLVALDLEFLGFQHPDPAVFSAFSARFPDDPAMIDLRHWAEFEEAFPLTFTGMYQFWAVKR